ncbi:MAG: hypothetical protein ACEPOZ_20510 [Marinifilaceae bacterium]
MNFNTFGMGFSRLNKRNKLLIIVGGFQLLLLLIFQSELTNIYSNGFIAFMGIYSTVALLTIYLLINLVIQRNRSSLRSLLFFLLFNFVYYIMVGIFHQ